MVTKEQSPFSPGKPVPIEYFVGRVREIERITRAMKQASFGRNENVFLTGERGIGKSSLANASLSVAEKIYRFTSVSCDLSTAKNVDEVCRIIFMRFVEKSSELGFLDKAKAVLGKYIKEVQPSFFGVKMNIKFTDEERDLRELRLDFTRTLISFYERMKPDSKGIFLILDNLNGITKIPEFAYFLKGIVDEIASLREQVKFPFLLMLVGIEERMADMQKNQPSLPRIFDVVELTPMSAAESRGFFTKSFSSVGISVDAKAMEAMVKFSSDLPVLLHEIGDAVFWYNKDDIIDEDDAFAGIIGAADSIGKKYLEHQVYEQIRSGIYQAILRKISSNMLIPIKRKEMLKSMSLTEARSFDNFCRRMKGLGILKPGERGEYLFTNRLYAAYFFLEARRAERETSSKSWLLKKKEHKQC